MIELTDRVSTLETAMASLADTVKAIMQKWDRERLEERRETDRQFKEWDERFEKNRREWKEQFEAEQRIWNERFEKERQGWDARFERDCRKQEREHLEFRREMGQLSNKYGTMIEDLVAPSVKTLAREQLGLGPLVFFGTRIEKHSTAGADAEFDVVAAGSEAVINTEVKGSPSPENAKKFVQSLPKFFEFFPEFKGRRLIPIFASLSLSDSLVKYLTRHGVYAMVIGGELMEIVNFAELPPDGSEPGKQSGKKASERSK